MAEMALPRQCCGTCKHWQQLNEDAAVGGCWHPQHFQKLSPTKMRAGFVLPDMALCSNWEQAE